jgi:membrane fusion protein, multidrug efflux system
VREITPDGRSGHQDLPHPLSLPDDTPLRVGMSVEANVVTREKPNALLVPTDAIQDNAVFAIEQGARAPRRSRSASAARARAKSCRA